VSYRDDRGEPEALAIRRFAAGAVLRQRSRRHVPVAALRATRAELEELAADPDVISIEPDREVGATYFPPWMAFESLGYGFAVYTTPERPDVIGSGIGIAVIDSGISPDGLLKNAAGGCTSSRVRYLSPELRHHREHHQ